MRLAARRMLCRRDVWRTRRQVHLHWLASELLACDIAVQEALQVRDSSTSGTSGAPSRTLRCQGQASSTSRTSGAPSRTQRCQGEAVFYCASVSRDCGVQGRLARPHLPIWEQRCQGEAVLHCASISRNCGVQVRWPHLQSGTSRAPSRTLTSKMPRRTK